MKTDQRLISAAIATALALPVAAEPLAGGRMTIFEADGSAREMDISPPSTPTLTVFTAVGAREVAVALDAPETPYDASLNLSAGHRYDKLRYTIPGPGVNILSELTWEVPAAEIRLDGAWIHASGVALKAHLAYAYTITGGNVQDSDYLLNDRQGEFSRSYAKPKGSRMLDVSLGAGWRLPLGQRASLTPMFGVAQYDSLYRMRSGRQVVSDYGWSMPLGAFSGLNSTYNAVWTSVWQGLEAELKPARQFSLRASGKYHWFDYQAEADWNLRTDRAHPISFTHEGHGRGWEAEIGADWQFKPAHRLTFDLAGRKLKLKSGKRTVYWADGGSVETSLNEVIASSWSARLGYRLDY